MVRLIIRDDDLNYFTRVEDVQRVYKRIKGFPVSFAVIPMVLDVSTKGRCKDTRGNVMPQWIGENSEISSWIKEEYGAGHLDVLMHGITHGYRIINGVQKAEMEWREEPELSIELSDIKRKMETLFDNRITVFVAPSNRISNYGLRCVAENGMHYSGIVPLAFNRAFTLQNIGSYLKRVVVRSFNRLPYPGVLRYSDHLELNACVMQGYDYLIRMYDYCDQRNLPLAINVHYWHIRDHEEIYKGFFDFIHYALDNGAIPARLSDVIKQYQQRGE